MEVRLSSQLWVMTIPWVMPVPEQHGSAFMEASFSDPSTRPTCWFCIYGSYQAYLQGPFFGWWGIPMYWPCHPLKGKKYTCGQSEHVYWNAPLVDGSKCITSLRQCSALQNYLGRQTHLTNAGKMSDILAKGTNISALLLIGITQKYIRQMQNKDFINTAVHSQCNLVVLTHMLIHYNHNVNCKFQNHY